MKQSRQLTAKILSLALASLATPSLYAQTESTSNLGVEVQGNLDFYYQYSSEGHAGAGVTGPQILEGRSFDRNSKELTLNFAELIFKKKIGKAQARVDIAAGEMVDQMSGGGSTSVTTTNPTNPAANEPTRNITQAILSYQATERLSFSFGKFYTNIGFEGTRAKDNYQYSRSYLFNYGPFWHQGVSVTYAIVPGKLNGTLYALNGWDGRSSQQNNSEVTLAANLNYVASSELTINYNYIGGDETAGFGRRELHELNALYQLSENYAVAMDAQTASQRNVNSQTMRWSGVALYFKGKLNNVYTISPRVEYFDDADGFAIGSGMSGAGLVPQRITAYTLTNSFDLGDGLETRLEVRHDHSSSDQFLKDSSGGPTDKQTSYALALLYNF